MPGTAKPDPAISGPDLRRYPHAAALIAALAGEIVLALEAGLSASGRASLVVSGGRSPTALFERLSGVALDWRRVWIALTDERWIDSTSGDSNEHLVRAHLLRDAAASAHFVGMKTEAPDPAAAAAACWSAIAVLPRPFDYTLLGMGDDGHTASLFPHSPGLAAAIDAQAPPACVPMIAPVAPQARMSLNLAALLDSRRIGVLIMGSGKWATYERAAMDGPVAEMPVRALMRQRKVPVTVYWSP
jgi:6-phosphogluconolactonase